MNAFNSVVRYAKVFSFAVVAAVACLAVSVSADSAQAAGPATYFNPSYRFLNPQPLPPRWNYLNPQPLPPRWNPAALNPQPLPPRWNSLPLYQLRIK